jgi:hypothetical protein
VCVVRVVRVVCVCVFWLIVWQYWDRSLCVCFSLSHSLHSLTLFTLSCTLFALLVRVCYSPLLLPLPHSHSLHALSVPSILWLCFQCLTHSPLPCPHPPVSSSCSSREGLLYGAEALVQVSTGGRCSSVCRLVPPFSPFSPFETHKQSDQPGNTHIPTLSSTPHPQ